MSNLIEENSGSGELPFLYLRRAMGDCRTVVHILVGGREQATLNNSGDIVIMPLNELFRQ